MISYIGLFLLFFTTSNAFLFPENKELTYDYHAIVQIGANEPSLLTSKFEIWAEIHTTKIEKGTHFQLKQIKHRENEGTAKRKITTLPEANPINYPFVFYTETEIENGGISVNPKDKVWSINMKRSIATLFQINEKIVEELNEINKVVDGADNSGFGKCKTTYTLLPSTKGHLEFSKRIVYKTCPSFVWGMDTSILGNADDSGDAPNIMESAYGQKTYDLIKDSDDFYVNSIRSDNNILHSMVKDEHFVVVDQTVTLKSIKDRNIEEMKIYEILLKSLEFDNLYETDGLYDLTGSRNIDLVQIKKDAKNVLSSVYNHVRFYDMDISDEDEPENAIVLIEKLKQLNEDTLYELYMELEGDKKYMYLTTLPLLGTIESFLTIQKLIKEQLVEVDIAVKMLQEISFHIKKPEAIFIDGLMELVEPESGYDKSIRNAAILSVSALLKSPPVSFYDTDVEESEFFEYIDYFISKVKEATEIEDRLVYMSALMNIQDKKVTEFLNTMVRNESSTVELTPHLRSLAMFGVLKHMKNAWIFDPTFKKEDFLSIFFNLAEDFEVRSTALFMLLNYGSPKEILTLFWFMKVEENPKFLRMFYTASDSYSHTTRDTHKRKFKLIQSLIFYIPKPKTPLAIESLSTLYDYFDSIKKYGSSLNVAIIENQNEAKLQTMYLKYSFSINGYNFDQHAIYLHEYPCDKDHDCVSSPIEVIIFRNNFAVNAFITSYQEAIEYIMKIDETLHFTLFHGVHQNFGGELVVASDIGFPIVMYSKKPQVRMLQLKTEIEKEISYNLTLNLWNRGEYGLKIYNPMAKSWYGVQRIHTLDLKFQAYMKRKSNYLILKLMDENMPPLGLKSSIHTEIFIDDGMVERKKVVPNEKMIGNNGNLWSYDDPNTGLVYIFEIAGCDFDNGAFKIDQIKNKFFVPDQRNWGDRSRTKLSVMAQYIWDTISEFPGENSCKIMLKIKRSENYPITHYKTSITNDAIMGKSKLCVIRSIFKGMNEDEIVKQFEIELTKSTTLIENESWDLLIRNVFTYETINLKSSWNIYSDGVDLNLSMQKGLTNEKGQFNEVDYFLNISMIGSLSEQQKLMQYLVSHLYRKCSNNPANKMRECVQKLSALRSYEYDISYYPESTSVYFMNFFELLMGKYFKKLKRTNEFDYVEKGKIKMSTIYPLGQETVDVLLIDDRQSFIIKDIPIDEFPIIGEPVNTISFSDDLLQQYCEFSVSDLWNSARVNVDKFELTTKWTRMVDLRPQNGYFFAVDAKRINRTTDLMALRVMVNGETLDVRITDKVKMFVDNKPLVISEESRYYNTAKTDIIMLEFDRKVLIHIKNSKVNIEFSGNYVRIASDFGSGGLCYMQNFTNLFLTYGKLTN